MQDWRLFRRPRTWLLAGALAACTVNRTVSVRPDPDSLAEYLQARHPADLLVTDSLGGAQWVHRARVDGDTLRGLRNRELPSQNLAIPVTRISAIAIPRLSAARTIGLVGAVLAAATVAIAMLAGRHRNEPLQ